MFARTYDGVTPTFNPGTGTEALFWNGTLRFTPAAVPAPVPPPPPAPVGKTLTVGAGQQYSTIAAAVNAAQNGDTIAIQAGTYVDQTAAINKDVTIKAIGGAVTLTETHAISNGKAYFVVNGNVTVDGITVQGATVASGNHGAG